jgi:hypothetical protein
MFILTMVLLLGSGTGATSITVEYSSQAKCMAAKDLNRENLSSGKVVLATCTPK